MDFVFGGLRRNWPQRQILVCFGGWGVGARNWQRLRTPLGASRHSKPEFSRFPLRAWPLCARKQLDSTSGPTTRSWAANNSADEKLMPLACADQGKGTFSFLRNLMLACHGCLPKPSCLNLLGKALSPTSKRIFSSDSPEDRLAMSVGPGPNRCVNTWAQQGSTKP